MDVVEVIGKGVDVVPVIVPEQLSDAVGGVNVVTAQEELIAGNEAIVGTGATASPACTN